MLEPRETDIPVLFIIFVVLPLVSYFLLGKWSESAKRKDVISLVDNMAVGYVGPAMQLPSNAIRQCARCLGPAKTRCSQCKSVWYCSGRCQITHWRQVHKLECRQSGKDYHRPFFHPGSTEGHLSRAAEDLTSTTLSLASEDVCPGNDDSILLEHDADIFNGFKSGDGDLRGTLHESSNNAFDHGKNAIDRGNKYETLNSSTAAFSGTSADDGRVDLRQREHSSQKRIPRSDEAKGLKRNTKSRINSLPNETELHNKPLKSKVETANKSSLIKNVLQENYGVTNQLGTVKVTSTKKSMKTEHQQHLENGTNRWKRVKMIFPYEEFVKCFQFEVFNLTPRGLVNTGNSCYANAVLQCLTCTKPLIIYLLRQSHSRAGCAKDWCLLCELEQLVGMLRENGGPLSPVNILTYIRSLNSQIGDGSQEDAHEFLRLLVASMQSICLEGFGGGNSIDRRLQDTTFIQHVFGGCLRSKVKCLRCHHESERHENMMDLTLEIFGWIESLEDALTQFTSSEDLDGDNMYRCARCATYVRARKQFKIQEAPNILTIVLKRFQEGKYGKINKCITFPEMLDMIPFMTGAHDIPPLYMLYAVVVHLDTSNASFSGHYISYVKDPQGNWFRVDDTEVQQVELSQVMSEGAYILFYMRSYPRPIRNCTGKSSRHQTPPQAPLHKNTKVFGPKQVLARENKSRPSLAPKSYADFSDAASSDWSHFTTSDDSSFTTESTRDSFSTLDHADLPFSSIFSSLYPAERATTAYSAVMGSEILTRFARDGDANLNYGSEIRKGKPQTYHCII